MDEETEKLYKKAIQLSDARTKNLADYVCSMLEHSVETLNMDAEAYKAEYGKDVDQNGLNAYKVGVLRFTIELMLERARDYK